MENSHLIALDDDEDFLRLLQSLFQSVRVKFSGFTSPLQFLSRFHDLFEPLEAGCLLVDLRLPEINGLDVITEAKKHPLCPPVILQTSFPSTETTVQAMRRGAYDVLEKPLSEQHLIEKIQRAIQHDRRERVSKRMEIALLKKLFGLTQREKDILFLVCQGKSSKEVAQVLDLSPNTVENYRARILLKMEVSSTHELICLVLPRMDKVSWT